MQHRKHTRWKPPDRGYYKVNYDGAVFEQQGRACLGVIIWNSEGEVMASMSQQVQLPTSISQVEALAARKATEFALEIGINNIVLEGDSEIVYKDLMSDTCSLALHGRIGNKAAHSLARRAILTENLNVWMEDIPSDILDVIRADSAPPDPLI
ncbi:uncharacterized protein LOC112037500 [Quercus suber]|uniref:uncharacterized protein LOC112037500 n=1 Tax=Quercus suber TaxID=58331 RepID=UPI000CE2544F|nr:uncharacterized protein LOC112037500 [Quercus suber]